MKGSYRGASLTRKFMIYVTCSIVLGMFPADSVADTDPHEWTGAPIGCQLICRRLEEEKLVRLMCIIRDAVEQG